MKEDTFNYDTILAWRDPTKDYNITDGNIGRMEWELYKMIEHDAINEVKFEGFPDRFMSHDIELFNYRYLMCCIDEYMGNPTVCRMSLLPNTRNIYGMPTKCLITYPDLTTGEKVMYSMATPDGVIPFYDTMVPGDGRITRVWDWIHRYANAQLTMDTQLVTHHTPVIMTGTTESILDKQAKAVKDLANGTKVLAMPENTISGIQVMDLKAPWDAPDLIQVQTEFLRRIYACLGLDAPSWQKKERLIVDEQEANDETLTLVLQDMLEARRLSCDLANEKYGWNVTVNVTNAPRVAKPQKDDEYEDNTSE